MPEASEGTAEATEVQDFFGSAEGSESAPADTQESGGEGAPTGDGQDQGQQPAEGQAPAQAGTPAPYVFGGRHFASQEEAERSYKEMQSAYTRDREELLRLQGAFQVGQGQEPRGRQEARASKYAGMSPEAFTDALNRGGYRTFAEAIEDGLGASPALKGFADQVRQAAVQEILESLDPGLRFMAEVKVDRDLDQIEKRYGQFFQDESGRPTGLRESLKQKALAPNCTMTVRQIWLEELDRMGPELSAAKKAAAVAQSAQTRSSARASAATRQAGTRPAGGGQAASAPRDDIGDFFGRSSGRPEAIPGTGLREAQD